MKRLTGLMTLALVLAIALTLAALLTGCDTVASTPTGGTGPRTHEDEGSTYRDAQDLTNWCIYKGLCSQPEAPTTSTTHPKGWDGGGSDW